MPEQQQQQQRLRSKPIGHGLDVVVVGRSCARVCRRVCLACKSSVWTSGRVNNKATQTRGTVESKVPTPAVHRHFHELMATSRTFVPQKC